MKVYEVVVSDTPTISRDHWFISVNSLPEAVGKAEKKLKKVNKDENAGPDWRITGIKEIGKLEPSS